ncbi:hypothetical protein Aspvir_002815 [Aspergillus viridinutans]|uniref:MORN repeat-containing protein n=1 Tax=Aspergillus viridinutans TaxID=75553 RepID=A0A9P3C1P8_ASPVI|nr:uncharacterized protein Aspvir_002815 [Aspergillus viridinutans]GIK07160.1 hypothetical protein Aspvir_002815 [Aspergillus viridinutans]
MTVTFYTGFLNTPMGQGNYEGYVDMPAKQPLGQGKMWFNGGNYYDGNWSYGRYHGTGVLKTATFEYTGDFAAGLVTGQGIMNYNDKGLYQGWFLNGGRHGRGTMKWNNGIVYTGQWKTDAIKGFGKVTWPNGDWWEATWDGSFSSIWAGKGQQGKGRARWHDKRNEGKVYVGATKGGLRHGFGTLTTLEYKFEGNFQDGRRDGRFKVTKLATQKITHRTYEDDTWVDD